LTEGHSAGTGKAIPHLSDFDVSPLGDYALVLVALWKRSFISLDTPQRKAFRQNQLAEIPWENVNVRPVVMTQWFSGKYVAKWTEVILARRHLTCLTPQPVHGKPKASILALSLASSGSVDQAKPTCPLSQLTGVGGEGPRWIRRARGGGRKTRCIGEGPGARGLESASLDRRARSRLRTRKRFQLERPRTPARPAHAR